MVASLVEYYPISSVTCVNRDQAPRNYELCVIPNIALGSGTARRFGATEQVWIVSIIDFNPAK